MHISFGIEKHKINISESETCCLRGSTQHSYVDNVLSLHWCFHYVGVCYTEVNSALQVGTFCDDVPWLCMEEQAAEKGTCTCNASQYHLGNNLVVSAYITVLAELCVKFTMGTTNTSSWYVFTCEQATVMGAPEMSSGSRGLLAAAARLLVTSSACQQATWPHTNRRATHFIPFKKTKRNTKQNAEQHSAPCTGIAPFWTQIGPPSGGDKLWQQQQGIT